MKEVYISYIVEKTEGEIEMRFYPPDREAAFKLLDKLESQGEFGFQVIKVMTTTNTIKTVEEKMVE